jgi:hypothetical protein
MSGTEAISTLRSEAVVGSDMAKKPISFAIHGSAAGLDVSIP